MEWSKAVEKAREEILADYSLHEIRKCDALQLAEEITALAQKIWNGDIQIQSG